MSLNSKISYLYRDADNYKVCNECVINGLLTSQQQRAILGYLHEGEWFIPSAVGLPENRFSEWDPQSDHPWFELGEYSFEKTHMRPTVDIAPDELVSAFMDCAECWDEIEADAMKQLDPMSVTELINQASKQCLGQSAVACLDRDIDLI